MRTSNGKALEALVHNRIDLSEFRRRVNADTPVKEESYHTRLVGALNEIYKLDPLFDGSESDLVLGSKTNQAEEAEKLLEKYRVKWLELKKRKEVSNG